jgi:hypothetical protein
LVAGEGKAEAPEIFFVYARAQENPEPAREMVKNLFKALKVDTQECYFTYWFKEKQERKVLPREKTALNQALLEEALRVKPRKVIFWGACGKAVGLAMDYGKTQEFAGFPAIVLHSPLEMMASIEAKRATWKEHIPLSGWF